MLRVFEKARFCQRLARIGVVLVLWQSNSFGKLHVDKEVCNAVVDVQGYYMAA